MGAEVSYAIREVAERANVPEGFVRQLIAAGALPAEAAGLGPREVRRARLLHSWTAAGLSLQTILALVDRGPVNDVMDAPVRKTRGMERSYQQARRRARDPWRYCRRSTRPSGRPTEPDDREVRDGHNRKRETCAGAGGGRGDTLGAAVYADRGSTPRRGRLIRDQLERRCAQGLDERR